MVRAPPRPRPAEPSGLYGEAIHHGVAFTPGAATMPELAARAHLRLSFGLLEPEELDEGVRRLARALRAVHRYDQLGATAPVS